MNKVVIINGPAGAGKDTFVGKCAKLLFNPKTGEECVTNYSSVSYIKQVARSLGWAGRKDDKSRDFLASLKDLSTRYNDLPFSKMSERVEQFNHRCEKHPERDYLLFLHIREPEEIERAKKAFGAVTVLVDRAGIERVTSNHADRDVYLYDYDYVVNNHGTLEELEVLASDFINFLRKQEHER